MRLSGCLGTSAMLPKEACCKSSGPAQVSKLAEMVTGMQDSRSHCVSLSRGTVMYRWCLSWIQKHLPASVSHSEQMPLAGSAQWLAQTFGGEICNPLAVCGFGVIWIIWTCFWRKNMHAHICTLIWGKRTIENITTMLLYQINIISKSYISSYWMLNYSVPKSQAMQMQRHRVGAVESQLFGCKGEDTAATMVQHGGRRNLSLSQIWKKSEKDMIRRTIRRTIYVILWRNNSSKGILHYFHRCLMCDVLLRNILWTTYDAVWCCMYMSISVILSCTFILLGAGGAAILLPRLFRRWHRIWEPWDFYILLLPASWWINLQSWIPQNLLCQSQCPLQLQLHIALAGERARLLSWVKHAETYRASLPWWNTTKQITKKKNVEDTKDFMRFHSNKNDRKSMLMNQAAPYSYWSHASKCIELGCCARHRSNRMTRQPSRLLSQTSRPWDQTTQECTRYVVCQLHTASNETLGAKTRVNTGNAFSCLRSLWLWSLCSQMLCTKFRLQVTRFSYHQLILQPVQPLAMKSAGWVGICQGMTKKNHETSFCHICGLDLAWHKFASSASITSNTNVPAAAGT